MRRPLRALLTLCLTALLPCCGDTSAEYTVGTCHLVLDNSVHQDATLAGAMNPNAPGIFCQVRLSNRAGAVYFDFEDNMGGTSSKIQNAIDTRRTLVLGYNNGLIVGYSALNMPATFYAFDRECPNCFAPAAIPIRSHPLKMRSSGLAICGTCNRQYNLNNDGFIVGGDSGKRLTRYRASTTGPFGVLSVY